MSSSKAVDVPQTAGGLQNGHADVYTSGSGSVSTPLGTTDREKQREETILMLFEGLAHSNDEMHLEEALRRLERYRNDDSTEVLVETLTNLSQSGTKRLNFQQFRTLLKNIPDSNLNSISASWQYTDHNKNPSSETYGEKIFSPLILLTAGGVAGAVSRTATAPLDRLKILFQAGALAGHHYTSIAQACRTIWHEGGWRGFFRGNGANVVKIAPETAIKFWVYENMKRLLASSGDTSHLNALERFVSGAVAGVCGQLAIYPLEVTKTRLALANKGQYRGISHCLKLIVTREGPRSLYRGLIPALSGIIPYAGVDLAVYSWLKDKYVSNNPSSFALLGCGAISSACGQIVSYPLVVVRTRLQAQGMPGRPIIYTGMMDCFARMIRQEGISSFYRGIVPNFMKAIPAISISYMVYEKTKMFLVSHT